jgi:type II secretory pathway pseudopilin PulG
MKRIRVTLWELLVTALMVGIAAVVVLCMVKYYTFITPPEARMSRQLRVIQITLKEHRIKNGEYPEALSCVASNLLASDGFDYLDDSGKTHAVPLDPWDREYGYLRHSPDSFTLWSHGPSTNTDTDNMVIKYTP